MNTQQLYEITRKDGTKQYAIMHNGNYFIDGTGFGYKTLDCVSIKPIDEVPTVFKSGKFHFDDEFAGNGICDINTSWNGWALPFIHIKSVKRLCKMLSWQDGDDFQKYTLFNKDGETPYVLFQECDGSFVGEIERLESTVIDGETYIYFGNQGLCFQFTKDGE